MPVPPPRSSDVILENSVARAEIVPEQGARVRSLTDLRTGRELLHRRPVEHWDPEDYLATLDGGWDQMFPNDDPWLNFPVHGVHWTAGFETDAASAHTATLRCTFAEPAVTVEHRYELLGPPRSGLRLTTRVRADAEVQPFLWSTHPMLAVGVGWQIDVAEASLEADSTDPGRVPAGSLSASARKTVLVTPRGWPGMAGDPLRPSDRHRVGHEPRPADGNAGHMGHHILPPPVGGDAERLRERRPGARARALHVASVPAGRGDPGRHGRGAATGRRAHVLE